MPKVVYFDLLCGASGDMLLASLVDLGVPVDYLGTELVKMSVPGLEIRSERIRRNGIMCSHMLLSWDPPGEYRHIEQLVAIIENARYGSTITERSKKILDALATAEAAVHGIPKEKVHFHEIGAVDTLIDVVGFCLALEYLKIDHVHYSTLTVGFGTMHGEHGTMPVPVPATAKLIEGLHSTRVEIPTEILTPTGAAILTTIGTQLLSGASGVLEKSAYGCGDKVFEHHPNLIRASLYASDGASGGESETVALLETDMDHISGEVMGYVAGLLMEKGALDVSWCPIFMKKGRPAYRLSVLSTVEMSSLLADLIIVQTRTLGVRIQFTERRVAKRENNQTTFMGVDVQEKVCSHKGYSFKKLEFESLAVLAREKGISLIDILEQYVTSMI